MNRTKVVVVGAGQMGKRVYLPTLARRDDVELAALVEPVDEAREQMNRMYRFERTAASVDELKEGQADCMFLLTRPTERRRALEVAFDLGMNVMMEKPMAGDLAEAELYVTMAREAGRTLMVGFNRRFMPAYVKGRDFVGDRPVKTCRVWKHGANPWGHSVHVIDVMRWFCGEPVEVRADGKVDEEGNCRSVAALVRFDRGAVGVFETSADYGMRKDELEIHGLGYSLRVYSPYKTIMYEHGREETFRHGRDQWFTDAETHFGFAQEIDHFLTCHADGTVPTNSAADSIKSQRLAAEILAKLHEHIGQGV